MREILFAMELRGRAAPVEGRAATLRAQTSGRGPAGETVNFASEVVLTGEHFHEAGTIEYAGRGQVTFETVGVGHIEPSPLSGTQWGAVIWRMTAGTGEFQGATGYTTSNFRVSATGEVVDNHYVRMLLP